MKRSIFSVVAVCFFIFGFFGMIVAAPALAANIEITSNIPAEFEYQLLGVVSGQPDPAGWQNYYQPGYRFTTPWTFWYEYGIDPPGGQRIVVYPPEGYIMADPILTGTALVGDGRVGNIIQFSNNDPAGHVKIELVFEPAPLALNPYAIDNHDGTVKVFYDFQCEKLRGCWTSAWVTATAEYSNGFKKTIGVWTCPVWMESGEIHTFHFNIRPAATVRVCRQTQTLSGITDIKIGGATAIRSWPFAEWWGPFLVPVVE